VTAEGEFFGTCRTCTESAALSFPKRWRRDLVAETDLDGPCLLIQSTAPESNAEALGTVQ